MEIFFSVFRRELFFACLSRKDLVVDDSVQSLSLIHI